MGDKWPIIFTYARKHSLVLPHPSYARTWISESRNAFLQLRSYYLNINGGMFDMFKGDQNRLATRGPSVSHVVCCLHEIPFTASEESNKRWQIQRH